jgi:hypothetical protein
MRDCQDPSIDLDLGPEMEVTSADLGGSLRLAAHWQGARGPPAPGEPPRLNRGNPGTCSIMIMMGKGRPRGRFRPGRPRPATGGTRRGGPP